MNSVLAMFIGIVVMMVLIIFTKLHAFPSLIITAILIALLSMPFGHVETPAQCISLVTSGFGGTMTSIGIVIGFGCIMGIFLEKSGAAKRMALSILKLIGVKNCDVVLGQTERAFLSVCFFALKNANRCKKMKFYVFINIEGVLN